MLELANWLMKTCGLDKEKAEEVAHKISENYLIIGDLIYKEMLCGQTQESAEATASRLAYAVLSEGGD